MLLVSGRSCSSENVSAVDEKEARKNITSDNGSVFSPFLDRSYTVSVQRKLGESINLPVYAFILR